MARDVYSQPVRIKLRRIDDEIAKLEQRIRDLGNEAEQLKCSESPIVPESLIEWESGGRVRQGRVIALGSNWSGYEYKVTIISKAGKAIGVAKVRSDQFPTLIDDLDAKPSKPNLKGLTPNVRDGRKT